MSAKTADQIKALTDRLSKLNEQLRALRDQQDEHQLKLNRALARRLAKNWPGGSK